jgi:hypothetical protein
MPGFESIEEPLIEEIAGLPTPSVFRDARQELPFILKYPREVVQRPTEIEIIGIQMDGTLRCFVHGERLLPMWATMFTKEEPTRLQHIVATNNALIEVPPRVVTGEGIPLHMRTPPQGTLPHPKCLIC